MDEANGLNTILQFHNKLREIKEEINKIDINEKQEERFTREARKEERLTREVRKSRIMNINNEINVGRFGKLGEKEEVNVGRFGKLGEKEEVNVGRFGKLGDELFADGILSVFNNIDESKSSLLKVENKLTNNGEGLQAISRIRNNLEEVISSFGSVVDKHIEVNDKNCTDCSCEKMDKSSYFIATLRRYSSEGLTKMCNEMEGDKFWVDADMADLNSGKKKQLISLVNILSKM